jgi:probable HAF family extracellular repeat protein
MVFLRKFSLTAIWLLCASFLFAQSKVQPLKLTFTTIDVPGASLTYVSGVNSSGEMVGWYVPTGSSTGNGFLLSGGNFTFLNYPGGYDTEARGITDAGLIVGNAYISSEGTVGFTYQGGVFNTIQINGYPDTCAEAINSAGAIVGTYGFGGTEGFELFGTKFKNIGPPGSYGGILATGINKSGRVVGITMEGADGNGFLYQNGRYKTITVPGSTGLTEAWGINDTDVIVGWYFGCAPTCTEHGFVLMSGRYFSFDYPGAMFTFALGINNAGQIVGGYSLDGVTTHGYVTSPMNASHSHPSGH